VKNNRPGVLLRYAATEDGGGGGGRPMMSVSGEQENKIVNSLQSFRQKKAGQLTAVGVHKTTFDAARSEGPAELLMSSIPVPPRVKAPFWPPKALTLFYGKAGASAMAAYNRTLAQKEEVGVPIDVVVECSTIFSSDLKLADLPDAGLVRANYMSSQVETLLIGYWRRWLIEEGHSERELSLQDWRSQAYIAARPDLISRLRETKEFGHIKAFSWVGSWGDIPAGYLSILTPTAIDKITAGWTWGESTVVTAKFDE
jgi:hypothetical protein